MFKIEPSVDFDFEAASTPSTSPTETMFRDESPAMAMTKLGITSSVSAANAAEEMDSMPPTPERTGTVNNSTNTTSPMVQITIPSVIAPFLEFLAQRWGQADALERRELEDKFLRALVTTKKNNPM